MADEYAAGQARVLLGGVGVRGAELARVSVPATECARIPAEFLEEERANLGMQWFRQEYLCEFVDGNAGVFSREMVEEALDSCVERLDFSMTCK